MGWRWSVLCLVNIANLSQPIISGADMAIISAWCQTDHMAGHKLPAKHLRMGAVTLLSKSSQGACFHPAEGAYSGIRLPLQLAGYLPTRGAFLVYRAVQTLVQQGSYLYHTKGLGHDCRVQSQYDMLICYQLGPLVEKELITPNFV